MTHPRTGEGVDLRFSRDVLAAGPALSRLQPRKPDDDSLPGARSGQHRQPATPGQPGDDCLRPDERHDRDRPQFRRRLQRGLAGLARGHRPLRDPARQQHGRTLRAGLPVVAGRRHAAGFPRAFRCRCAGAAAVRRTRPGHPARIRRRGGRAVFRQPPPGRQRPRPYRADHAVHEFDRHRVRARADVEDLDTDCMDRIGHEPFFLDLLGPAP